MSAELPFEYSQRRSALLKDLISAKNDQDREAALQAIEEGDRELEDYLAHMPSGGGVSTYCNMVQYFDLPSGSAYSDDCLATVTIPRNVDSKAFVTFTFTLTFVNGSPYINHNVEILPTADGFTYMYNTWNESDTNNSSIVFSALLSGSFLIEIPAGDGDFEVGITIRNTGYADCQVVNAFIVGMDVGTAGAPANCLIVGSS